MIVSLPFDVLLDIFFHLQARDILNIRSTCKALFVATEDRSVWVQTLSALPLPYTALRLSSMSLDQLMRCAVTSARLDETWRRQHFTPKTIRYEPSDVSLIHARLLPGGEWIVSLSLGLVGGEVHLQRWDSDSSSARIDCPPGYFTGTAHITCKTFLLSKHENLILYYNAYQITLFRSNTAIPSLKSLQTISSTTPFVSVSAADGMLAYHTLDHEGRDAVCIRTVGPEDTVFQSIMAPAGRAVAHDSTMCLISKQQFLMCDEGGIFIYGIPQLTSTPPTHPLEIQPIWSYRTDLTDLVDLSPIVWDPVMQCCTRPIAILCERSLSMLQLLPEPKHLYVYCSKRDEDCPSDSAEEWSEPETWVELCHYFAVGFRFAMGYEGVYLGEQRRFSLKTCTFPGLAPVTKGFAMDGWTLYPDLVGLGSFTVPVDQGERMCDISLDEESARILMMTEAGGGPRPSEKRLIYVSVV